MQFDAFGNSFNVSFGETHIFLDPINGTNLITLHAHFVSDASERF